MKRSKFNKIHVYKAGGYPEPFSRHKLQRSLKRAGLPLKQCKYISDKICDEMYEGQKTRDIYRKALKLINQSSHVAAVHYSLKKAIFDLGPSGHHFEVFVARYFEELGYDTKICQVLKGQYVNHEVDVIATMPGKKIFVECKFHNHVGIKNDIKMALYVKARWDDLKNGPEGKTLTGFHLASNTAFTLDAITYARGTGLNLLGVNAPEECSFLEQIKKLKLYPITSLRRLNRFFRNQLLEKQIVMAKDLRVHQTLLMRMGMKENDFDLLMGELDQLLRRHA
jgi:hypothetical protein